MENYDQIAQDLRLTIQDYKLNLVSLKQRFADISNIIERLDHLKQQAHLAEKSGEEMLAKVAIIEVNHSRLSEKIATLTTDYDNAMSKFNVQIDVWNESAKNIIKEIAVSISDLKNEYNIKLSNAISVITQQANDETITLNQYLQQFSNTLSSNIGRSHELLEDKVIKSVIQNSSQISQLISELDKAVENGLENNQSKLSNYVTERLAESETRFNTMTHDQSSHYEILIRELGVKIGEKFDVVNKAVSKRIRTNRKIMIAGFVIVIIINYILAYFF